MTDDEQSFSDTVRSQALSTLRSTGQFVSSREEDALFFGVEYALAAARAAGQ